LKPLVDVFRMVDQAEVNSFERLREAFNTLDKERGDFLKVVAGFTHSAAR